MPQVGAVIGYEERNYIVKTEGRRVGLAKGAYGDHPKHAQVAATFKVFVASNNEVRRTISNSAVEGRGLRVPKGLYVKNCKGNLS
jgi:hypothetical protein